MGDTCPNHFLVLFVIGIQELSYQNIEIGIIALICWKYIIECIFYIVQMIFNG